MYTPTRSIAVTTSTTSTSAITATVLTRTTLQFGAATVQSGWLPQWSICVEVLLPMGSNVTQIMRIIEQLCGGTDPSVMLVCQEQVRSLLLYRYAHNTVTLVEDISRSSASKSRSKRCALWWSFVPITWKSTLKEHWQVADMIYTHARRAYLRQRQFQTPPSADDLFDQYRYRPAAAEEREARQVCKVEDEEEEVEREGARDDGGMTCVLCRSL